MRSIVIIAVVWWSIVGCIESPPMHHYTLITPTPKVIPHPSHTHQSLKVLYPRSLKSQAGVAMHYHYSGEESGVYLHSAWSNDIGKLLEGSLIEALSRSGVFGAVVSYHSTLETTYRLESTLYALEHRIRGEASYAILSVECRLIDAREGGLVKSRRFSYQVPTTQTNAKGYAEATNHALARFVEELLAWLIV